MKGGKGGRKRRSPGGAVEREGAPRGKPKPGAAKGAAKGGAKRPASTAPKKGSRKQPHFGGMPASGDE